jgi:hypothetical protein
VFAHVYVTMKCYSFLVIQKFTLYDLQCVFRNLFKGLYLPCYDLFSYHSQSQQNFPRVSLLGRFVVNIYDLVCILPSVYTSVINFGESP